MKSAFMTPTERSATPSCDTHTRAQVIGLKEPLPRSPQLHRKKVAPNPHHMRPPPEKQGEREHAAGDQAPAPPRSPRLGAEALQHSTGTRREEPEGKRARGHSSRRCGGHCGGNLGRGNCSGAVDARGLHVRHLSGTTSRGRVLTTKGAAVIDRDANATRALALPAALPVAVQGQRRREVLQAASLHQQEEVCAACFCFHESKSVATAPRRRERPRILSSFS